MRVLAHITLPCLLGLLACGHGPTKARRVAVMPVSTLGLPSSEGTALRSALQRAATKHQRVRPAPAADVDRALAASKERPCESDPCLAGAGKKASAELVLAATLAGLGEMRLVRARLIQTADAIVLHDLQKTVRRDSLTATADDLTRRLFPTRGSAWYRKWWVWTAAAVLVASATTAIVWGATRDGATPPVDEGVTHLGDL